MVRRCEEMTLLLRATGCRGRLFLRNDIIAAVSGDDDDPVDARMLEQPELPVQNCLACQWQEAFRAVV